MLSFRPPWICLLLCSLASFVSCSVLSNDTDPRHAARAGFSVRVDGPGLPPAAVVVRDIEAYAQGLGFTREPAQSAPGVDPVTHQPLSITPDRYMAEGIVLEVSRQPTEHRVTAYLHGTGPERGRNHLPTFYREFSKEYAGRYGGTDRFSETAYSDAPVEAPRPAQDSSSLLPPIHL